MEDDQQLQRMDEEERYQSLLLILDRAVQAHRAGWLTKEDILTMQHEFGLYQRVFH